MPDVRNAALKMNVILTSIALCTIIASVSGQTWCYHSNTCDPPTWPTEFPDFCNGSRQSPINIDTALVRNDVNLTEFNFTMYDSNNLTTIKNTGKFVRAFLDEGVQISGGGLLAAYNALYIQLKWGNGTTTPGSEHTLDGKRYPMELQIYHKRVKGSSADSEPLAVLAFFIEALLAEETEASEGWKTLASYLTDIETKGQVTIKIPISLDDLLGSVDRTKYYRYLGSVTKPTCKEIVVWTVFKEPIKISRALIDTFGSTVFFGSKRVNRMVNNFRNTQPNQDVTQPESRIIIISNSSSSYSSSYSSSSSSNVVPTSFLGLVTLFLVQQWARKKQ